MKDQIDVIIYKQQAGMRKLPTFMRTLISVDGQPFVSSRNFGITDTHALICSIQDGVQVITENGKNFFPFAWLKQFIPEDQLKRLKAIEIKVYADAKSVKQKYDLEAQEPQS